MPLIQHGPGPDREALPHALTQPWDWVLLTSPEAASVFLEVCIHARMAGLPAMQRSFACSDPQNTRRHGSKLADLQSASLLLVAAHLRR